ncbi:hydrolase-HD superfamily protein [Apiospora phragmitis]|uniref:Hydrolase-HD superfamily protein n=1 Tax=Apiospora phragmitis TaxID=2905665 RepID=A0ABR1X529_9PEZI
MVSQTIDKTFADPGVVVTRKISEPWSVDKVLATVQPSPPAEGTSSPVPFFHLLERLKTNKREGWRRFGIERLVVTTTSCLCRKVMASPCAYANPNALTGLAAKIDLAKCMKMCLVHDMAESIVGDITPVDGVPKPEKSRREAETMDYIAHRLLGKVHGGVTGREIREIWQEYEDSETLDSLFVHDIDKMELLCQMVEYEKRVGKDLDLGEFAYVATKMVLPETKKWADEVLAERDAFWQGKDHVVHGELGVNGGVQGKKHEQQDAYYSRES